MNNIKINLTFQCRTLQRFAVSSIIRKCICATFREEAISAPLEINVLVTDDENIRAINRASRNIDKATDVLSFPMFDLTPGELPDEYDADPATGLIPLGDMCLSIERVAAQAKEYGHSRSRELAYLVVHSVLHLLGYDHLDEGAEKARMRAREEAIMALLQLSRKKT